MNLVPKEKRKKCNGEINLPNKKLGSYYIKRTFNIVPVHIYYLLVIVYYLLILERGGGIW
jgi:peptidoglycan/LPS O-acetylase OafA/YrhL